MAFRKACAESSKASAKPTHALVQFEDDNSISVVAVKRIVADELIKEAPCKVQWARNMVYSGLLLAVGKSCGIYEYFWSVNIVRAVLI